MWELIRANRRKSFLLFFSMGVILLILGYVLGRYTSPRGGWTGMMLACALWLVWSMVGYFKGDSILLSLSSAKEVDKSVAPQLFNVVEEMKIAASLPFMPRIFIIDEEAPNAFAVGRNPQKSAIAVTAGLLVRLDRDELQGVVAHEMSHILNRDIQFMTFAGILLGSIVLLSDLFLRNLWFSPSSSRRYRSSESDSSRSSANPMAIVAIILAVLAPIFARLLYLAVSRKREYLADATAVRLTRYPDGLASALEKISSSEIPLSCANQATAPLYIINPLKEGVALSGIFSTHPPMSERVKILRNISAGASYENYQNSYQEVTGKAIMPASALMDRESLPLRPHTPLAQSAAASPVMSQAVSRVMAKEKQLSPPATPPGPGVPRPIQHRPSLKEKKRELGDLMRTVNQFIFLQCLCGLKIKVPPDFKHPTLNCPRCNRLLTVASDKGQENR